MEIDSVRSLKKEICEHTLLALAQQDNGRRRLGVRALAKRGPVLPKTIALGVSKHKSSAGYALAVRIQHPLLLDAPEIGSIREKARGEVDIRFIGSVRPLKGSWFQTTCRPLRLGCSVGQYQTTAGTLGAFVQDRLSGAIQILSNNHVLAKENGAVIGDRVLQPGIFDHGIDPADAVGYLQRYIPLSWGGPPNIVDCATARIMDHFDFDASNLGDKGKLAGGRSSQFFGHEAVFKIGRTTGLTEGFVSAVEVDNVTVSYDGGSAIFDSQIEVQGLGRGPFASGGDSGSLVFDRDNLAFGMVFSGTLQGGDNQAGLAYLNSLDEVLNRLSVDLLY